MGNNGHWRLYGTACVWCGERMNVICEQKDGEHFHTVDECHLVTGSGWYSCWNCKQPMSIACDGNGQPELRVPFIPGRSVFPQSVIQAVLARARAIIEKALYPDSETEDEQMLD